MKPIVLDKIASVTAGCRLRREVRVSPTIPCREGDVLAVRVLTQKTVYDRLELTTGRFSQLQPGDVFAGALGPRRALRGYAGRVPESLATGDIIQLLNMGGVLGECTSANPDVGAPFDCEVLGQVLHFPILGERIGVPAHIAQDLPARPRDTVQLGDVPVVVVVGTCMDSGKTYACHRLIQEWTHQGLTVHAAKATGVSLRRDVLAMEDAGARRTRTFTEFGVVTTTRGNAPDVTQRMLLDLSADQPDVIVLELGDGLLGDYGVDAILDDAALQATFKGVVLAASDPVGTWGAVELLSNRHGLRPHVVTGPATDNVAGTDWIHRELGLPAHNARVDATALAETVHRALPVRSKDAHGG